VSDDAYIAVFGKEHAGHVRGMGHGVVPSKYLGRSSGTPASTSGGIDVTREELDASNAKIRSLEEQIAFLTQQFALHSRGSQVINSKHAIKKLVYNNYVMFDSYLNLTRPCMVIIIIY
jgi:ABC-type phosphate/phosphonate transport system ATPase subunit